MKHPKLVPEDATWDKLSAPELKSLRSIADQDDMSTMAGAMHVINAVRMSRLAGNPMYKEVGLLSFPQEFSAKNIVLHGVAIKKYCFACEFEEVKNK